MRDSTKIKQLIITRNSGESNFLIKNKCNTISWNSTNSRLTCFWLVKTGEHWELRSIENETRLQGIPWIYFGASLIGQTEKATLRAAKANENLSSSVNVRSITLMTVGSCKSFQ